MFTKCIKKTKQKLQKYFLKLIDRKKKKLKNDDDEFIYFFYKDSLNDLNDIENLNFKYKSKRCQRRKESLSSMEKKVRDKYKKKNVKKIKAYYTLIKHSINVQTLMKLDNHSIR